MADLRRCIGSAKFGIEAHEAPVGDFPAQPSQTDGLGRMCKPHWTEYTRALRKDSVARKAAGAAGTDAAAKAPSVAIEAGGTVTSKRVREKRRSKPEPIRTRPARIARGHEPAAFVGVAEASHKDPVGREEANAEEAGNA